MIEGNSPRGRVAVLLAIATAVGVFVASTAATASADGRTIGGTMCGGFCMQATFGGQTASALSSPSPTVLDLRPGTYWLNVVDDDTGHDFAFRSCPGSTTPCEAGDGPAQEITTKAFSCMTDGSCDTGVTVKVLLQPGTHRLFCDVGNGGDFTTTGFHEAHGMYVDLVVGGVGPG